jgi:hypothetical protein
VSGRGGAALTEDSTERVHAGEGAIDEKEEPTMQDAAGTRVSPETREGQHLYEMDVLNLIHIASEIRAGRAEQLAKRIEDALPEYLREMETFEESSFRTLAFYETGQLYATSKCRIPQDLEGPIETAEARVGEVLSDDCFAETVCNGGVDCHRWPTSLPDIDVNTPDPMGWHYILHSHCGFHWPRFWRLDCGVPKGLKACTGG